MLKTAAPRIANAALRALATGSKFALILVLAKLLEPADVGTYGVFAATVFFSVLMIGGDYYTYAQRELVSVDRQRWSFVLQHQAIATSLLYLVLLPSQLVLFWFDLLPASLLAWFFLLLVLEHLAHEINRILVAMRRPLIASWILLIRMGAWVWPLLGIMWFTPQARTLDAVFFAWLLGAAMAVLVGFIILVKEAAPWQRWPLDLVWLKRGFGVGLLFLTATLCFKALTTADRYVVEFLVGPDLLGVYVLQVGLSMAIPTFLDPAVYSFLYPRIVSAYRRGDTFAYRRLMKELAWSATTLSLGLAVIIALAAPFVLSWIGRPIYLEHMSLLWLLLSMAVAYSIGMVPHYALYARGADRAIVAAHISALFVFGAVVAAVAPYAPFEATAYGLLASFMWMGSAKLVWYYRLTRQDYRDAQLNNAKDKDSAVLSPLR